MKAATSSERELTLRVVLLGAALSALLAAANAYLGLFAGMTVSASIPAAVFSMGILRAIGGTIYENNLVQTAASAGESAAAGAIFTLPALIMLGAWAQFDLLLTGLLIGTGGLLGVLFTIVIRRPLVTDPLLPFPEGTATYEVLRAGHGQLGSAQDRARQDGGAGQDSGARQDSGGMRALVTGSAFGALAKLLESGLSWSRATVEGAFTLKGLSFYLGTGCSPALAAVGYIVGFDVAVLMFLGGFINWVLVLPWVTVPEASQTTLEAMWSAWSQKTRYLGVGAMTVGGLAALFEVRGAIKIALIASVSALGTREAKELPMTERDLPTKWVLGAAGFLALPVAAIFYHVTGAGFISLLLTLLVLVFGFLFSAVAAYMAGLVGSSNNPVSGVTIATILFTSLLLSFLGVSAVLPSLATSAGPAAAILVGSVVCTAAALGGDNMQDLKAGHLLGATPYRQQWMQMLGVVAAALVLGPVLQLLLDGYGFGAPTAAHPNALRAPQATLMASVADGVFGGTLPWNFFTGGVALGLVVLACDRVLIAKKSSFRTPVLAVALGLYLPFELSLPVLFGAVAARLFGFKQTGLLVGAGLITGEALMGILLAFGVGALGGLSFLKIGGAPESALLSLLILGCSLFLLSRRAPTKAS